MLPPAGDDLRLLSGPAADVWKLLDGRRTPDDICRKLAAIYRVDPGGCRDEVTTLIREFRRAGLVEEDRPGDR